MPHSRRVRQQSIQKYASVSKASPFVAVVVGKRKHEAETSEEVANISASIKKRKTPVLTPTDALEITTKHTLAQYSISLSASALKRKRSGSPVTELTPPSPPRTPQVSRHLTGLSLQLEDVKSLASAFLSSLTLQYAHNRNSNSVDIRILTPSITRMWGKRKVTLDDVRRVVSVIHAHRHTSNSVRPRRFLLKDFGKGKVCIEMLHSRRGQVEGKPNLNESNINNIFKVNLDIAWHLWVKQNGDAGPDIDAFISSISLEPLTASSTLKQIAPMYAQGQSKLQQVLTPFKPVDSGKSPDRPGDSIEKAQDHVVAPGANKNPDRIYPSNPLARTLALFDRIKLKEETAANMPALPTKQERQHKAALERALDLLEIINLLLLSKGGLATTRASFPLSSIINTIQSSVRTPLSKDEVLRCLHVLQTEVAPGHVSMLTFGDLTAVVIDSTRRPLIADVKASLRSKGVHC